MTPATVAGGEQVPTLHVIGAGLIGTSIALAATRAGWSVTLEDADASRRDHAARLVKQEAAAAAQERPPVGLCTPGADGTGNAPLPSRAVDGPELVCVAVPPRLNSTLLLAALHQHINATVMDVCSVKSSSLADVEASGVDLGRLVWTHPMAGAEGSGPEAARADLFDGRTWIVCTPGPRPVITPVITPAPTTSTAPAHDLTGEVGLRRVRRLIDDCRARPLAMTTARHDELLALTSHLPQLVSSALASEVVAAFTTVGDDRQPEVDERLEELPPPSLLAGPGLLDMTRIAASPSELWAQIASMNRQPVRRGLRRLAERLAHLDAALEDPTTTATAVTALVDEGRTARGVLDRKHAGTTGGLGAPVPAPDWTWVRATIADVPGTLARVFAVAGELGVNIEDVQVDHAPYASQGLVSVAVRSADAERLAQGLA